VLADPIPQAAASTTGLGSFPSDLGSSPTDSGSSPSEAAAESSLLASISSLQALESSMPILAPFAESAIISAIPSTYLTGTECETTTPGWYYSLPADVKSALSSYDSAFLTWYAAHSTDFGFTTASLPGNVCGGTVFASGTADASTTKETAPASKGGHATVTSGAPATTPAGGSATAGSGTSGPSSSTSKAAAAQVTGFVGASLVGIAGVFGLMVAL